ncbi:MAG: type II secretion system protein GspN [Myxococcales bacterium]|nr:type II secretion system protein GspN [Myxococcales bacterium]
MMRWIALLGGCAAAGASGLVAGFYTTFPSEEVARYAEVQFHARNKDYALEVGDVRPWWLPGVRATDVTLYTVKKGKKSNDNPAPSPVRSEMMKLDALAVRLQVLPRLAGKWAFGYTAELLGGDVSGTFSQGAASIDLNFVADGLDLALMPIERDELTVHLAGKISGKSNLALDGENVKNSTGALELSFEGLQLAEGSKVMGLELPVVSFSVAKVKLEAQDGALEVTEGTFDGDVIDMTLSGDISLNKKLERSRNRLKLVVSLPEDLDKLAKLAPAMKRARDEEGGYHFNIGGTIGSPTFRPGRGSDSKVAKSGAADLDKPDFGGLSGAEAGEDVDPEVAREERKKRREERVKERRERLRKRREESAGRGGDEEEGMMPPLQEVDEGDVRRPLEEQHGDELEDDMGPGAAQNRMPDLGPPNLEFGGEEE